MHITLLNVGPLLRLDPCNHVDTLVQVTIVEQTQLFLLFLLFWSWGDALTSAL